MSNRGLFHFPYMVKGKTTVPVLVLEEPRLSRRAVIASSCDPDVIRMFWASLLLEAEEAVRRFEESGDEVLAAVERADLERLRRVAPLFGGAP